MEITKEEKAAIVALKKVAKKWPKSLWLFSASGSLCVMKCKPDGTQAMTEGGLTYGGYVDQDYIIDSIDIPNDGGDW